MKIKHLVSVFLTILLTAQVLSPGIGGKNVASASSLSPNVVRTVDTMKESRDGASTNRLSPAQIQHTCNLIATMNVTHITVDTQYDYPDFMRTWVQAVRATGKKVWFRGNWNNWEGNNQQPADLTPNNYISKTVAFIGNNQDLFEDGDIFDPCAEPENSPYWINTFGQNWTSKPNATDAYNNFIVQSSQDCGQAFDALNVQVETGMRSTNPWIASRPSVLYNSTVQQLGYVTIDAYPGQDTSLTPEQSLLAFQQEVMGVYNARNMPIVLGEFGYSIDAPTTNTQQLNVLQKWFDWIETLPWISGINYWVGPGYSNPGSSTTDCIFEGTTGDWRLRPAGEALKNMYGNIQNRSQSDVFCQQGWSNNGFETGTFEGTWYKGSGSRISINQGSVSSKTTRSGNYALVLQGAAGSYAKNSYQVILSPNTTYNFRMWVRVQGTLSKSTVGFMKYKTGDKYYNPVTGVDYDFPSLIQDGEWHEYSMTFTTNATDLTYRFAICDYNYTATLYVDDVILNKIA